PLALDDDKPQQLPAQPLLADPSLGDALPLKDVIGRQRLLKAATVVMAHGTRVQMTGLREFAPVQSLYVRNPDGSLRNQENGRVIRPDRARGFFVRADGARMQPGFQVGIGWDNYRRIFVEPRFREPFLRIFAWT